MASKQRPMFRRFFRYLLFVLLFLLLISVLILVVVSPAQTTGTPIATIEKPIINGVRQGIIIRGTDTSRPVLLFVHGGPGMPSFPYLSDAFKNGMEKLFTVCYWEQRGAGLSYTGTKDTSGMNLAQFVKDGVAVTQYLKKKFNKQKIYLLGHSWGTWLGSFMAKANPELYYAYIGIGQLGNTYNSETASRNFVLVEAAKQGDKKMLRSMQQHSLPSVTANGKTWEQYLHAERQYVFALGGARYGKKRTKLDIIKEILFCREYSIRDKWNYGKGIFFSQNALWPAMISMDLNVEVPEQSIPVYIFQGIHDHQTDYALGKAYFDKLKAPEKKFYTFFSSAHSPHLEEYDVFESIIRKDVSKHP